MKIVISLLFIISFLYSNKNCFDKYAVEEVHNSFNIYVYNPILDDEDEEDLELAARMYLINYLRNKTNKKLYGITIHNFTQSKLWKCNTNLHAVYMINQKNIHYNYDNKQLLIDNNYLDYKKLRKKIIQKIAKIETKDNLGLVEYQLLYNLYFSIGKVSDVDRILDKIINLKMKAF